MELNDDNIDGSLLQLQFNYSSLPVIDASNEIEEEEFRKNYIERNALDEPSDGKIHDDIHLNESYRVQDSCE